MVLKLGLILSLCALTAAHFYQPECADCTSSLDCAVGRCMYGMCVTSYYALQSCLFRALKPECGRCRSASQCETKFCGGRPRRCHNGTRASLDRCFKPDCARCGTRFQCASRRCEQGRCVRGTQASRRRCGVLRSAPSATPTPRPSPTPKQEPAHVPGDRKHVGVKADCMSCVSASDCRVGYCTSGVCSAPTKVLDCAGRECSACAADSDCAGGRCAHGMCSDGSEASLTRCGLSRECGRCKHGADCAGGRCVDGACSDGSEASLTRCGFVRACGRCSSRMPCATRKCVDGLCVRDDVPDAEGVALCGAVRASLHR